MKRLICLMASAGLLCAAQWPAPIPIPGNPVITHGGGGWKDSQIQEPAVMIDPGNSAQLIMYFAAMGPPVMYGKMCIGRATAPVANPTQWTEYPGNPILCDVSRRLNAVQYASGTFYLYTSNVSSQTIDVSTSTDGIHFTATTVALTVTGQGRTDGVNVVTGSVLHDPDTGIWHMYYGWQPTSTAKIPGIRHATSSNGITWTKQGTGDIFSIEPGTYWSDQIEWSQALKIGGIYLLTIGGFNAAGDWTTDILYSTSPDSGWAASPSNPVLNLFSTGYIVSTGAFYQAGSQWYLVYQIATSGGDYNTKTWDLDVATTLSPLAAVPSSTVFSGVSMKGVTQ